VSVAEVHTLVRTVDAEEVDPFLSRIEVDPVADVTVVIPTITGRDELLQRALLSASQQTRPPKAIIVVKDKERRGAAFARNLGLTQVQTTWTAWLDDDDELLEDHIESLRNGAAWSGADLVYSYAEFVGGRDPLAAPDEEGILRESPIDLPWNTRQEQHIRSVGNFIPVTYMVKTELAVQVGGMPAAWSPEWPQDCEDWGFLIRLLDAGAAFHHVPKRTWRYYFHDDNTGGRSL